MVSIKSSEQELKFKIELDEGQETAISPIVTGHLDSIIIDSVEKVSVVVQSKLGYLLLHVYEHEGTEYYAPRAHLIAPERNLSHSWQFDKFFLSEELEIIVSGPKGAKVGVILRFS